MCQHHNNSHYVSLLANLVENYSTNLVEDVVNYIWLVDELHPLTQHDFS
jgi:hypothetical protein